MSLIDITTEIGKSIIALVDAKTGGAPDKETIVSSDGKVSAVGVKESNNNKAIKTWVGTLEEYEALETIDENTLYTITDDIEGDEVFATTKVNLDGSNYVGSALSNVVEETHWNNKITNCITEIPQRIKLELKDGVLTLKAGSEVIIPNGFEEDGVTKKFDYVTVESDISYSTFAHATISDRVVYLGPSKTDIYGLTARDASSGDTQPSLTRTTHAWYDTANNIIKWTSDTGATWVSGYSLPICVGSYTNGSGFDNITQIFNGMGYIGSTVWVDKGVKGLIPNGRNADGTLNNNILSTNKLIVRTFESTVNTTCDFLIGNNYVYYGVKHVSGTYYYDTESNHNISGENMLPAAFATTGSIVSGVIKFISPVRPLNVAKTPSEISSYAMPSSKYIDLTLGASQSTYMAPANGWIALECVVQTGGLFLCNTTMGIGMGNGSLDAGSGQLLHIPVSKGDVFMVDYTGINSVNLFKFVYAQGEI